MPEYCRRGPLTSFFLRAGLSICETFCLWWLVFMRDPDAPGGTSDIDDGGWMPMVANKSATTMVVALASGIFPGIKSQREQQSEKCCR